MALAAVCEFPDIPHGSGCLCLGSWVVSSFPAHRLGQNWGLQGDPPKRCRRQGWMAAVCWARKHTQTLSLESQGWNLRCWGSPWVCGHLHRAARCGTAGGEQGALRLRAFLPNGGVLLPKSRCCHLQQHRAPQRTELSQNPSMGSPGVLGLLYPDILIT